MINTELIIAFRSIAINSKMPRRYKRKPGSRTYKNFSEETMEQALLNIGNGTLSILAASKQFKIPYGTLHNKFMGKHGKRMGGQTALSVQEEKAIVTCIVKCADWGYPLSTFDVQMFTKSYLERIGKNIPKFQNGVFPGKDWVKSFMQRHDNEISERMAANITRARAGVTKETMESYFNNLKSTISDCPPSNLFNYDETNVSDDPGKRRLVFRRGTKYPEHISNHSKAATSIMMCGAADGTLLPPYVIYRSENMWDSWTLGGPQGQPCCNQACCSRGTRYNRTKNGWMEVTCFTDWFETIFLPHARRLEGKKVMLGDNLASHFSDRVIELCTLNNIQFACLPSNSTHICQPLDVSFFKPMKNAWRKILTNFKMKHPKVSGVPKDKFPSLLKECLEAMDSTSAKTEHKIGDNEASAIKRILKNGFEACGIAPFNPNKVLSKLVPANVTADVELTINDSLTEYLKMKKSDNEVVKRQIKKKKMDVQPGKSVSSYKESAENTSSDSEIEVDYADESDEYREGEHLVDACVSDEIYVKPSVSNLNLGTYVLVKVLSGKRKCTSYLYAAIIQEKLPYDEFQVTGLKSLNSTHLVFKIIENDIFTIPIDDIKAILPTPITEKVGDRITKYKFNRPVDVREQ